MKRNIIVIGASAGGFKALTNLVAGLPSDLNAAIFIVWHLAPDSLNILPRLLNEQCTISATTAVDRQPVAFNQIFTAPADRHLILERGYMRVTAGPKENRFRPAVDPLFRSAALAYGSRVIGVILSGALDDGTAGLGIIKKYGGLTIVQDPFDAEVPSMPANALRNVEVDYQVTLAEMAGLLTRLTNEEVYAVGEASVEDHERDVKEIDIALQDQMSVSMESLGNWTPFTCPDCNGVLAAIREGDRVRYRCHTGHAFSADSLLDAITSNIENSLWSATRLIKESIALLNYLGDHYAEVNDPKLAARFFKKAGEAEARMKHVWLATRENEHLNTDILGEGEDNPPS